MASEAVTKPDTAKADAAAEKAYADAASAVPAKKKEAAPAKKVEAAAPAAATTTPKIDAAVAKVKAAPKKAAPKKAAKPAAKKAAPKKSVAKAAPVKKPAVKKPAAKKTVTKTATTKTPLKTPAPKAAVVTQMKDKIMATAKTTTTDYTAKVKEFAADAQTKAKAAYDKMQAYAGEMTEFTKGNVEAMVESGKILGSGMQDMARGEVEAAKGAFETATADLKAMAAVKSPTELFKLQGELARRNFDAMVKHYSKNAEVSMKLANDAFAPLSSRMSLAAEKVSKVAA